MKIKQLCQEVKFNDVFYALQYMYKVQEEDKLNYLRVFRKIRNAKVIESQNNFTTVHVEVNSDYKNIYDCYGMSTNSKHKQILRYSNIEEWANFYVVNHNFTHIKFMAHILYEATRKGFTNEEIDKQLIKQFRGNKND